ncbi:4'-phosphopantetheinyl transferase family protein [Noviherbaspirillum aerium]|uniref:4'-phosphopantetheinyl transferase family protein n=1 Tax=Noviherbaspirillum aerium TaxID=2588497 RepID=UPI00178C8141|nr:4'-phosphopantetheinyl transferase superfamily protein [Noviherbaspirillum aerium]
MLQVALPEVLRPHVEAWRLDPDLAAPVTDADWAVLGKDEKERALRFGRHEDRVRYVATRATLRRLLAARLGRRPQDLRFMNGFHGKPRLAQSCGSELRLEFNVSHAGAHGLIAISRRRAVGVDIERRIPAFDVASLEQQVLSPFERRTEAERQLEFFERWVVKEAVLKAIGTGVASHLQQLSVEKPLGHDERRYGLRHAVPEWPSMGAWRLDAPTGYAAAIAYELDEPREPFTSAADPAML